MPRPLFPLTTAAAAAAAVALAVPGPPPPGPPPAPGVPYADLLDAERHPPVLLAGPSRLIELGGPGDARHTLDGFLRPEPGEATGGVAAPRLRRFEGGVATLEVPIALEGEVLLRVCGAAPAGGRFRVRVDGEAPPRTPPPPDGGCRFREAAVHLDPARFGPGPHTVRIEGTQRGPVAIDWLRVEAAAPPPGDLPPPPTPRPEGRPLRVPDGWTVAHPLVVPGAGRLVLGAAGERGARLELVARRDGAAPRRLATMHLGATPARVEVDLGDLAGELARLDLVARGGEARISRLVVDAPPPRTPPPDGATAPRHVVVVLVDTLRADHTGPYGGRADTPAIDAFARDAAVFRDARAPASWTKPSVASLLTGWHPWQHLATTHAAVLPDSVPLLPERLGLLGHESAAFVTNAYVSEDYGFRRGWDHFDHSKRFPGEVRRHHSRAQAVAARVDAWLAAREDPARPLFLYVHLTDPHTPYLPPDEVLLRYDGAPYDGWIDFEADARILDRFKRGEVDMTLRDRARLQALYAAEVTSTDDGLGRLFAALRRHGVWDDALVVLTSDHGEELLDHGSVLHGHTLYDELVRVPLIVRAPGVTDGGVSLPGPASLVHVARTLFDALGQRAPDDLAGPSLWPVLRGLAAPAPLPAASARVAGERAVAYGPFKLIETRARAPYATAPLLYDLRTSPDEKVDAALTHPIAREALRGWLGLALGATGGGGSMKPRPADEAQEVGAATEAQLRALGYL